MTKISEKQQEIIEKLAQKYSLELLLLFGSQVTGKTHKESDFDVAYRSSRNLALRGEGRLINDLVSIFDVQDERIINLVNIKNASPLLLYAMTSNCQVLFEKMPAQFAALRAYAFKKYIETRPLYNEKMRRLAEVTAHY